MTVLAVKPGEQPIKMELDGSLESMQAFVGGTIQAIYPFDDPVAIVCNEEGKLMGLECNRALRDEQGAIYDILCGPFFVCGLGEEDFASLSGNQMETYYKLFEHPELFLSIGGTVIAVPI